MRIRGVIKSHWRTNDILVSNERKKGDNLATPHSRLLQLAPSPGGNEDSFDMKRAPHRVQLKNLMYCMVQTDVCRLESSHVTLAGQVVVGRCR